MSKAFACFDKAVKILLFVLCVVMTCVEMAQIILRYVFKAPMVWAEESVRYMFIWCTFLAIGLAIDRDSFAKFDLLLKRIPDRAKRGYNTLLLVIAIVFFAMMTVFGIRSAIANSYQITSATQVSYSYVIMAVPCGSIIAIIYALKKIVSLYKKNDNDGEVTGK